MAVGDKLVTLDGLKAVYQDVNGNIVDLKSAVSNVSAVSVTLPWQKGGDKGVKYSDGTLLDSSAFSYTDYVPVANLSKIIYKQVRTTGSSIQAGMAFYDVNKTYITGIVGVKSASDNYPVDAVAVVPANAVYARFTYRKDTETYGNFSAVGYGIVPSVRNEINADGTILLTTMGTINSNGSWSVSEDNISVIIHVAENDSITIKANSTRSAYYGFLKSANPVNGQSVDFVSGASRVEITAGNESTITIPATCNYLYLTYRISTANYYPAKIIVNGIDLAFNIREKIMAIDSSVEHVSKPINVKYESGAYADGMATGRLHVYVPASTGYILYLMYHFVDNTNNSNCWQIYNAYWVNDDFDYANRISMTQTGEWECAVHLYERDDFSGGHTHGDEVMQGDAVFLMDGLPVSLSDFTSITPCRNLRVIRTSKMYDPNDSTTEIANHGVEYIFENGKLTINQSLEWLVAESRTTSYMCMFPPSKAKIDRAAANCDFEVLTLPSATDVPLTTITKPKANAVTMWDTDSGFFANVEVQAYPTGLPGGDKMTIHDNGNGNYNKVYFYICSSGSSTIGELWKSKAIYQIDYKPST